MKVRYAALAAAACWSGFAVVLALVWSHRSDAFDAAVLQMIYPAVKQELPLESTWLFEAVRDFTALGGPVLRNLLALTAIAALVLIGERTAATRYFLTVTGAWLLDAALKTVIGRPRPTEVRHLIAATGYSFPSGHSFNAAAVYIAMALVFAQFTARSSIRVGMIGTALAITWVIVFTRVWLGVHYPTDVIAGWLGGTGWALCADSLCRSRMSGKLS